MLNLDPSSVKLLLVDDDPAGRRMMAKALGKAGYLVTATATCREALESCDSDGPFHLVIADINLPDGNGRDLAGELSKRFPKLLVILCSGDHGESGEVLHKPFSIATLRSQVETVLSYRPSPELSA